MKMAIWSIDLIIKKRIARAAHFFSYQQKKTDLHVQHAFLSFFAIVWHDYNAVLYD